MRITNPASGELIREVAEDTPESVAEKAGQARAAQRAWQKTPFEERHAAIARFRSKVVEATEKLAAILTDEVGKPLSQSKNELAGLLPRIDFFLEHTRAELEEKSVFGGGGQALEERIGLEALGVVANISAWNYPYFVGSNVFLPALLTGSTVLYKPSEFSTLTGLAIAELLHDAGVPRNVFAPVIGGAGTGQALLEQAIDGVFFTGSYATGKRIAAAVAPRMLRLQLELGGKDPAYVADDVDVASTAAAVADGAFYNAGQSCCAVERIYVHERIWPAFIEEFVKTAAQFVVGDPRDAKTYIGPLARREAALADLERQVADARDKGATIRLGGKRLERPGFFFEPTVVTDVDHSMAVMRDESFGPIIGLMPVASDEAALELMSDTEYGLTAACYTKDRARAERILSELDVGTAYWNCCDRVSPRLPWSGRRHSGIGSTLSTYGIEAFLKPKAWHLKKA